MLRYEVGRIEYAPNYDLCWDSVARRYVERSDEDHEAMETFGIYGYRERPVDFKRLTDVGERIAEVRRSANDNKSRGPYITTYTGRFYFNDPRPEDFEIEDIAHSLAMTRRYSGHGKREYTTAEHSVHIYRWLTEQAEDADTRLAGLLHDAPEALSGFGDAARPRKKECPHIASAEFWIWKDAIAPKFGLPIGMPEAVHEADRRICADEMAQNLWEVDPNVGQPLGIELEFWDFGRAKAEFLCAFREIQRVRGQWMRVG